MNSNTKTEYAPNWPVLGGLRFLMALLVACAHLAQILPDGTYDYFRLIDPLNTCVGTFFVVSGFSMAHSLRRSADGFYRRRAFRVLPMYYFGIFLSYLPFLIWGRTFALDFGISSRLPSTFEFLLWATLLVPALIGAPGFNWSLWSIPVELTMYAISPAFKKLGRHLTVPIFICGLATFVSATVALGKSATPIAYPAMAWFYVAGWWLFHDNRLPMRLLVAFGPPCAILALGAHTEGVHWFSVFLSAGLCGTIALQDKIVVGDMATKALNWVGDLSFPLYIVHSPIGWLVSISTISSISTVALALSLLASVPALYLIDKPLRRLGKGRGVARQQTGMDQVPVVADSI